MDMNRAFQDLPIGLCHLDLDLRYVYINDWLAEINGIPAEEHLGRTIGELIPDVAAGVEVQFRQVIDTGEPIIGGTVEAETSAQPEIKRHFQHSYYPVRSDDGEVIGISCVVEDVTVHNEALAALQESEARFSKAFRSNPSLMAIAGVNDGKIYDVNDSWCSTMGFTRDEAIGKTGFEIGIWVDPSLRTPLVAAIEKEGSVRDLEIPFRTTGGEVRDFLVAVERIELDGGPRLLFVSHDITERKELEAQLREAQKLEALGRLAGGIAHDFNNILFVINSNLHFLGEGIDRDDEKYGMIDALKAAGRLGGKLTQQLSSFGGRQSLRPRSVDLAGVVAEIAGLLRRTLPENIRIETAFAEDTQPVMIDSDQFENVLINLAVNARDAMPTGGVLSISVDDFRVREGEACRWAGVDPGRYTRLMVADTGTGMSPEVMDRAFEPYFSTKEPGAGSGLGLSMVYGFAKQSGGHAALESQCDMGTTIRLYLPVSADGTEEDAPVVGEPVPRSAGCETILVVEDDAPVMDATVKMLRSLGYRTLQASNGAEALAILDQEPSADLLLTDIVMPGGMDGDRLASIARRRRPGLKVLFASGYAAQAVARVGQIHDDVELIFKPYSIELLASTLRNILNGPAGEPRRGTDR